MVTPDDQKHAAGDQATMPVEQRRSGRRRQGQGFSQLANLGRRLEEPLGDPVRRRKAWGPRHFLLLDVLYVAILAVLLISRQAHWLWIDRIGNPIGGIVPLGVPWFGALGAVTISIYGIVDHSHEWQAKWNLWHVVRPVVGAILGTLAFLIFISTIQATGSQPTVVGSASKGPSVQAITYLVIAFVVGFREETFRSLIKKVVDVLLSPGNTTKAPSVSISPSPMAFGLVATNQSRSLPLTVANNGTDALVIQGPQANPPGTVLAGSAFELGDNVVEGATINAGTSATLVVKFAPTTVGDQQGALTISCNAGKFPVILSGTGV